MSPISQRFPIPKNDDDFEEMGLELLRRHWSRQGLEIFGKRGERQYGVDILDVGGETPIYAAQCKLKEEHKSLSPAEIQTEVDNAKQFTPPLGKYAILTTAKVSAQAQKRVREINEAHRAVGLFELEVLTWDRLCSLLQQYSDVRERFYGGISIERATRIEQDVLTIKDGVQSLTSRADGDDVDSQINEARDHIQKREFQFATFLLNRVLRDKGDMLTPRQRFRVLSNEGAAMLGLGKLEVAAKLFLEALPLQPQDEQGKINEALAYYLTGDVSSTHEKAKRLRSEYPASSRVAALWISSAPKEVPLSVLEFEMNSVLRADAEVCVALARRGLSELAFLDAFRYASLASRVAPRWSQPYLVLAQIALISELEFPVRNRLQTSLIDAEEACSKAFDLAHEERDRETETNALVCRFEIRLLLKKKVEALKDAEDAADLNSEDPRVMLTLAQARFAEGRVDDGMSILKKAYIIHRGSDVAFMYGKSLNDRGRESDLDTAVNVLLGISVQDVRPEIRPALVSQTIQTIAKKKDWATAEAYLRDVAGFLDSVVVTIIRGYLAHYQDLPQEAERCALEARSLMKNGNPDTKEFLARLLMLIGRPGEALPLWHELFESGAPGFDPANLLDCAARLRRDDLVLQTCDQLHRRGVNDWSLLEFEIPYLQKYKINVAIERLQIFLRDNPAHKLATLHLSSIGLLLNRRELVRSTAEDLPRVDELPIQYVVRAVQVMKYGGNPTEAVDYSYRFLRENFNEVEAHRALIISMMPGSFSPDIPAVLDVVEPDAAVCYQELAGGTARWVVLENTDKPSGEFEEISSNSTLAAQLMHRKVGETVVIAEGAVQDRVARIVQILPKWVRRYQESMGEMQVRFGPATSVESVRFETPDIGLDILKASVERRASAVESLRELYNQGPVSMHTYGSRFGKNAYVALADLAQEEGQRVKCSFGNPEEHDRGLHFLQTAKAVVVEITALATLRLLGLQKVLSSTKYKFIISERTWITLHEMLSESRLSSAIAGTMQYKDGKHVMYEETTAEKLQRNREDEEFVRLIEKATELQTGIGLAAIEPGRRDVLERLFGSYGAESMVLASHPDYVLWTDDLVLAQASAQEFGVRRVWTQLILLTLADAGLLTSDEYSETSARLIGMEFVSTVFDVSAMFAAFKLAAWSSERRPAAQIVRVFADRSVDLQRLMELYVPFTERLYREPLLPDSRCSAARALLNAIASRPGAEAMAGLKGLRKLSARVFGLNAVGKEQFDNCFDQWLMNRDQPLILSN